MDRYRNEFARAAQGLHVAPGDNFTNWNLLGSVIIGEFNSRNSEPATTRNFLAGLTVDAAI